MDINGTKFHLLTGPGDWLPFIEGHDDNTLWWDDDTASVSLLPQILQFPSASNAQTLTPSERRGAARDLFNNFFWIADSEVIDESNELVTMIAGQSIRYLPSCETAATEFWSLANLKTFCDVNPHSDFEPVSVAQVPPITKLQGLAITTENYLVVGSVDPGGLLVFDLHAGGPPSILFWPEDIHFQPFDLAPAVDGGLWILDRDEETGAGRCWRLDRHLRVIAINPDLEELSPQENDFSICEITANSSAAISDVTVEYSLSLSETDPISIIGLEDDSFLILSSPSSPPISAISRYLNSIQTSLVELGGGIVEDVFEGLSVKAHDFAFLSMQPSVQYQIAGELMVVLESGDQALAFNVFIHSETMRLQLRPSYFPLRQFKGRALVSGEQQIFYDLGERWYPLVSQPRRRYVNESTVLLRFDGKEPNCLWHRIVMDACIPDGTEVVIESRATDEESNLDFVDWNSEASPFRRATGTEIAFYEHGDNDTLTLESWEWVFKKAQGRFIELSLTLKGNTRKSPKIRALRVYYPRFSYLEKFLPGIYQEQDRESHFLNRYLANVEGIFTHIESLIARSQVVFDTRTAPDEYIDWLASWLGGIMDESWDDSRKRLFIDNAELLYRWRGTKIGMLAAIKLAIEPCVDASIFSELINEQYDNPFGAGGGVVRIEERFLLRDPPGVAIAKSAQENPLYLQTATSELSELGDSEAVSQRYREFLYRKYVAVPANTEGTTLGALVALSEAWEVEPIFESFDEIDFFSARPQQGNQLGDWTLFIRRELARVGEWDPAQGVFALHIRYQEWLRQQYCQSQTESAGLQQLNEQWQQNYNHFEEIAFSPVKPSVAAKAADWLEFIEKGLGFTYSPVTAGDAAFYREFLARRYRQIDVLNLAYGLTLTQQWPSFADIELPVEDAMPQAPTALHDWIQFASLTLPIRNSAHRFSVLVPTKPGDLPEVRERRMAQVEKIVDVEKPAHTDFDVKLFWALFQVGSARLGVDTIVGGGARYTGIVLGGTYLGQGYVQSSHPWNLLNRTVTGRDRLQHAQNGEH